MLPDDYQEPNKSSLIPGKAILSSLSSFLDARTGSKDLGLKLFAEELFDSCLECRPAWANPGWKEHQKLSSDMPDAQLHLSTWQYKMPWEQANSLSRLHPHFNRIFLISDDW